MGDYLFDATINGVLDSADTVVEWLVESREPDKPLSLLNLPREAGVDPALITAPQTSAASFIDADAHPDDLSSPARLTP